MARLPRVVLILAALSLVPLPALAQPGVTGLVSGQVGVAVGGDASGAGLTPALSVAVVEQNGWGAELDLAHTIAFADDAFAESGLTTLMINAIAMGPERFIRPFGTAGVGLLHVRAEPVSPAQPIVSRTDWAFNAGGGVLVALNDAVGVRGELRYFRFFQNHADVPLASGGFFDFWRPTIGVTWSWPIS